MVHVIGNADEFWRVRLTRVDTTDALEFEWHEDILYREPSISNSVDVEFFHVEAVRVDDPDTVMRIATFADGASARAFLSEIAEALGQSTKSAFESAYFDGAEAGDTGIE